MKNRNAIEIKNMKFKAYINNVEVPFVSFSMQALESGYTFSIAIPPTGAKTEISVGTYGFVLYSNSKSGGYKLLCDGYLVSDTPYANRGVYSQQLLFRDMISSLRFFYIDNSLLEVQERTAFDSMLNTVGVKKTGKDRAIEGLLAELQHAGVDIIGKVSFSKDDNLLTHLAQMSLLKPSHKESINALLIKDKKEKKKAIAKLQLRSGLANIDMKKLLKNQSSVSRLIGLLIKTLNSESGNSSLRSIYGLSDRFMTFTGQLKMNEYAFISTFSGLSKLAIDMMYTHGGITDFLTLSQRVLDSTGLKMIVIPGMTTGQCMIVPNTPYMPVLNNNKMGSSFDSMSVSKGNDVPTTDAIAVFGLTASRLSDEQPYFGVSSAPDGLIHRLTHISKNPLEYLYAKKNIREKFAKDKNKMKAALKAIANDQLNKEARSRTSVSINTNTPLLSIVPGFGFKLNVKNGRTVYGRVSNFSLNVSTENISQTIVLDQVISGSSGPYGGDYGINILGNIGLYDKESVGKALNSAKSYINKERHGSISANYRKKTGIWSVQNDLNKAYFSNPSKNRGKK